MRLTDYSREQIQQLIKDGICPTQVLRDYEILKELEKGETVINVAFDHNIQRTHVYAIKKKYPKV